MTVHEILTKLPKKISKPQLYRYFKVCDPPISPVGAVRQKPQQYPDDTVQRLEVLLGLRIVGLDELRQERRRAAAAGKRRVA